ncbi:hypothetical protein [Nocardia thraciensis]
MTLRRYRPSLATVSPVLSAAGIFAPLFLSLFSISLFFVVILFVFRVRGRTAVHAHFFPELRRQFRGESEKFPEKGRFSGCVRMADRVSFVVAPENRGNQQSECVSRPAYAMIRRDPARLKWGG